jgi:hypothetical protein
MAAEANSLFADNGTIALPFARVRTAAAPVAADAIARRVLDHVVRADVLCLPDNTAMALVAEHLVIPVELSPTGIVIAARPLRRGSSWE